MHYIKSSIYLYLLCMFFVPMLSFAGAPPDEPQKNRQNAPIVYIDPSKKAPAPVVEAVSAPPKPTQKTPVPYKEVEYYRGPTQEVAPVVQETKVVETTVAQAKEVPIVAVEEKKEINTEYPKAPKSLLRKQDPIHVNPKKLEMQELKLQMRELASQLLDVYPGAGLEGSIALPTSFVNLDDFNETSSLGRYMAETLIYEFNARGFPVQEYRIDSRIRINELGEFVLTRTDRTKNITNSNELLLIGTYTKDANGFFVNARLVRNDGLVLRAGEVVLPMNDMLARMSIRERLTSGALMLRRR